MEGKTIIEMHGIIKAFYIGTPNQLEILHGINLTVKEGEFVSIVGASGSGKSTLMNIIGVLDRPTAGNYILDGIQINSVGDKKLSEIRNKKIGFVFQNFNLISRTSAIKNIELPMLYAGIPKQKRTQRAKELLELVEMQDRASHMPNELSGGQKQRVAIAGIIAMRPNCIVLDEPTAMLDPKGRREVLKTIRELNRNYGITIILITHYMDEAAKADRVVVMDDGKIIFDDVPREVFSHVEELKAVGLDVPQVTELAYELKKNGLEIDGHIITEEECIEALIRILQN